ncbi:MogA/MoaB family molybdenum cofactor biosynthesis protein [Natronolimnobius baerhuensis]|uniref:Molybdenum cofactor biosynthesis protein n=1 Tax=Natronolimnobius baerhuensis TaxID=253108 RepID=A0A202EA50_9EURY|nr:molybdenum cofactor synthesis domain-containing protein [Natronolimnobius baerhuensis]OVE84850.1 molybdenum cofactor biosynthesis protein [Natronolimnobius baerhuensis]
MTGDETPNEGDSDAETASPTATEDASEAAETTATETDTETDADSNSESASLEVGVITIAANRSLASDDAGTAIETALEEAGHNLTTREHVAAEHDRVQSIVLRLIERDDVDLVITAGATSIEPDDVVIEAVDPLLDKELTAFRELFTMYAADRIGTRVVAMRTLAGVADGKPVFCLPGNPDATELATEKVILPEATHLIDLARADDAETESAAEPALSDDDDSEDTTSEDADETDTSS